LNSKTIPSESISQTYLQACIQDPVLHGHYQDSIDRAQLLILKI